MKILLRALLLLLLPVAFLGLLYLYVVLNSSDPRSDFLVRTCDKKVMWPWDDLTVTLHINGDRRMPVDVTGAAQPRIILLILDHSSSMDEMDISGATGLQAAKAAAAKFARDVAGSNQVADSGRQDEGQYVGAIMFDGGVDVVAEIQSDGDEVAERILRIPSGGSTDIALALTRAHELLSEKMQLPDHLDSEAVAVLLSDGESAPDPARRAADLLDEAGIRIITIGLGNGVDMDLLCEIATTPADCHHTLDPTHLGDIYTQIAGNMSPAIGYRGRLQERYNYGPFKLEAAPLGYRSNVDPDDGTIETRLPILFNQRTEISYQLKPRRVGLVASVLERARLTYKTDPDSDSVVEEFSDKNPPVVIMHPVLLLLLFLPFILYALWRLAEWMLKAKKADVTVRPQKPPVAARQLSIAPRPPPLPRAPEPALFIGVGSAGSKAIAATANRLVKDRYLKRHERLPFRFMTVDVATERPSPPANLRAEYEDVILPQTLSPELQRLAQRVPEHLGWIQSSQVAETTSAQSDLSKGSGGLRWLPRLSFFHALESKDEKFFGSWDRTLEWLEQQGRARIFLVGSIGEGTASSILADLANLIRQGLTSKTRVSSPIVLLALSGIPEEHGLQRINQKAFLEELGRNLVTVSLGHGKSPTYDPDPTQEHGYLVGEKARPLYDHVIIINSRALSADEVEDRFLSQVGALCHIFTERGLSRDAQLHFDRVRQAAQEIQIAHLEGTVHTARLHVFRFPVPELIEKLGCRFVMEVLGPDRLVGLEKAPDGTFSISEADDNALQEIASYWSELPPQLRAVARSYQIYCQQIGGDQRADPVGAIGEHFRAEGLPDFALVREETLNFATAWFSLVLNGPPFVEKSEVVSWRREKITKLYYALERLTGAGRDILERLSKRSGAGDYGSGDEVSPDKLVAFFQSIHERWLADVKSWLKTLIGEEILRPRGEEAPEPGTYRLANNRLAILGDQLRRESEYPWQVILGDDLGNRELAEERLYDRYLGEFLEEENGFLLRWIWSFTPSTETDLPSLRLRLITNRDILHAPGDQTAGAILEQLLAVANSRCAPMEGISIVEKLTDETGQPILDPVRRVLEGEAGRATLDIDHSRPSSGRIQRHVAILVPNVRTESMARFEKDLHDHIHEDVELVRHGDPHMMGILVIDSVVPIQATGLLEEAPRGTSMQDPFINSPEKKAETIRRSIESKVGVRPCPEFHPLVRLLLDAPLGRSEWVGILAEDVLHKRVRDGYRKVFVLAFEAEALETTETYEGDEIIWALLNVAYEKSSARLTQSIVGRWRSRSLDERISMLQRSAERLSTLAEEKPPGVHREIMKQIGYIVQLEEVLLSESGDRRGGLY